MEDFIIPLSRMSSSLGNSGVNSQPREAEIPFQDIFKGVLDELHQTDEMVRENAVDVASGNDADRLHDLTIASTKADMALKLFVQLRNKGHDAYSEIMRMSV